MKKYLTYLLVLAALTSCVDGHDLETPIRQSLVAYVGTRASDTKMTVTEMGTLAGEKDMNENLIRTIDIFFYGKNDVATADARYHRFVKTGVADDNWNGVQNQWELAEIIDESVLTAIFGDSDTEAVVYMIANYYNGTNGNYTSRFSDTESRKSIRGTILSADFDKANNENPGGIKEECFVMEGTNTISKVQSVGSYFVQGEVVLYRAASKVRLATSIPQDVIDNGVKDGNGFVWKPVPADMKTILVGGVNKGVVCAYDNDYVYHYGDSDYSFPTGTDKSIWWSNYGHKMKLNSTTGKYEHEVPFYSYPTKDWKATTENEAYMILLLPWKRVTDNKYVNTYYQIPIAQKWVDPEYRLKSNRYYRMEVEVSIMGSFSTEDLVELTNNSYIILDWCDASVSQTNFEVNMSQTSYLALEKSDVEMNNVSSASIPYASSHPVTAEFTKLEFYSYYESYTTGGWWPSTVVIDRMRRVVYERNKDIEGNLLDTWTRKVYDISDYSVSDNHEITDYEDTDAGNPFTSNGSYGGFPFGGYSLTTDNGVVALNHDIPSSQFVWAKITAEVTNPAVAEAEVISFTQYPGIYIEGQKSNGYVFANGYANNNNNNRVAYDDIENRTHHIGNLYQRNQISGSGNNNNRNIYTIHISSFSDDTYILGDPRTVSPVSLANLSGTNGKYYPTKSDYSSSNLSPEDDTENMISPEFMIASSYGTVSSSYYMTYDQAKKRCAAYQENGYPAGRWRMPTAAEVKYIMTLSAQEKIPSLFNLGRNDGEGYWCANGKIQGDSSALPVLGTNTQTTSVRCVYDTWFWGSEPYTENATTWLGYQY